MNQREALGNRELWKKAMAVLIAVDDRLPTVNWGEAAAAIMEGWLRENTNVDPHMRVEFECDAIGTVKPVVGRSLPLCRALAYDALNILESNNFVFENAAKAVSKWFYNFKTKKISNVPASVEETDVISEHPLSDGWVYCVRPDDDSMAVHAASIVEAQACLAAYRENCSKFHIEIGDDRQSMTISSPKELEAFLKL